MDKQDSKERIRKSLHVFILVITHQGQWLLTSDLHDSKRKPYLHNRTIMSVFHEQRPSLPCGGGGTQGWRYWFVKKIVAKSKEVKTGWQVWQNLLRTTVAQKGLFWQWWRVSMKWWNLINITAALNLHASKGYHLFMHSDLRCFCCTTLIKREQISINALPSKKYIRGMSDQFSIYVFWYSSQFLAILPRYK
jgi:hypothetical protein